VDSSVNTGDLTLLICVSYCIELEGTFEALPTLPSKSAQLSEHCGITADNLMPDPKVDRAHLQFWGTTHRAARIPAIPAVCGREWVPPMIRLASGTSRIQWSASIHVHTGTAHLQLFPYERIEGLAIRFFAEIALPFFVVEIPRHARASLLDQDVWSNCPNTHVSTGGPPACIIMPGWGGGPSTILSCTRAQATARWEHHTLTQKRS
jgi:hypothetical protein